MTETLDRVRRIVDAVSVPVIADVDTGYGSPLNVVRTVSECVRLGIEGVILEDQFWPKKCGHMEGKSVIPMEEQVEKIRAAVYAKGDAITPIGFEEAVRRGHAVSPQRLWLAKPHRALSGSVRVVASKAHSAFISRVAKGLDRHSSETRCSSRVAGVRQIPHRSHASG